LAFYRFHVSDLNVLATFLTVFNSEELALGLFLVINIPKKSRFVVEAA